MITFSKTTICDFTDNSHSREKTLVDEFRGEFEKLFAADICLCPM